MQAAIQQPKPTVDHGAMLAEATLNYHPLTNQATTAISAGDLLRFLTDCGHEPMILGL